MVRNKISISLILRKDKKRQVGDCPIYYLVLFNGKQIKIPTGKYVFEKDWDNSKRRIKSSISISNNLSGRITEFNSFVSQMELAGKSITPETIKDFFKGADTNDFYAFYEKYIKRRRKEFSDGTYDKYLTTLKILKEYKPTLSFSEINYKFVLGFDSFLSNVRKNVNGKFNRHKNLKTVILEAIRQEHSLENPYLKFKQKYETPSTTFITLDEILKLEDIEFKKENSILEEVRDMFVFSCFCGLRFSDIVTLKWTDLDDKNETITKIQVKTNKKNEIPLCLRAIALIKKYEFRKVESEFVFNSISNQKTNANLKTLADKAGIKKCLTYHVSRHTCASNLAENNINLIAIRNILGHANIKETQRYAKVSTNTLRKAVSTFDTYAPSCN